jgi:flavodoxin
MSDYPDYNRKYTDEEKEEAFRILVKEAVMEQTEHYPRNYKSALAGSAFEGRGFQDYHIKALIDALENTDALLVLGRIVGVFGETDNG